MVKRLVKVALITCLLIGMAMVPLIVPAEILTANKSHPHSAQSHHASKQMHGQGLFERLSNS